MGWFYGVRMGFIASGKLSRKHGKSQFLEVNYGISCKIGSHNNGKLWSTNETMR